MKDKMIALLRALHTAQETGEPAKSLKLGEEAFHIPYLVALDFVTVDDLSDEVGVTTAGRLFAGIRPDGHMDLPVEVAELTCNIEERELAARYIDAKIRGVDHHILHTDRPDYRETYEHCGIVLKAIANEFRQGMHIPSVQLPDARVIPYNETNDTGQKHEASLRQFFADVHERNVKAGWWSDITTGEPKKRNIGELLILFITEIVEAYDAWLESYPDDLFPDDKLKHFPGFGVEIADLFIRGADLAGAALAGRLVFSSSVHNPGEEMLLEIREIAHRYEAIRKTPAAAGTPETGDFMPTMDIAQMVDAKLAFNAVRPDHKIEARLAEDGKKT